MNTVYIGLGSNVGEQLDFLRKGKELIGRYVDIIATSPVYETEPVGTIEKDKFLNAVVAARTELSPQTLLWACLAIEKETGRVRSARNAPRTLDLDLLLYEDLRIKTPELTVPHPRMHERAFVLAPLADIHPELMHPVLKVSMRELLSRHYAIENLVQRTDQVL